MNEEQSEKSIAPRMAMTLYTMMGLFFLANLSIASTLASLLSFGGALGAFYRKKTALDFWLVILAMSALISLITIDPLDPDYNQSELDIIQQGAHIRVTATIVLYGVFLTYFNFLNKLRQFPKKQIISFLVMFLFMTVLVLYLRGYI